MKLFALVLSSLFFVVGCAESGSGSKAPLEQAPEKPRGSEASCLYSFDQGSSAPVDLLSERKVKSFFGKVFDENKLIPLLDVSGSETVRFAQLTGVRFYKTNYFGQDSCSYTKDLPAAPTDVRQIFDSVGKNLLGLYLPKKYSGLKTVENEAAIQVRIDSDRWTLTHEFMHHLFNTVATQSGLSDDQVKAMLTSSLQKYDEITKTATDSDISKYTLAAQQLNTANVAFQELMRRFSLEEMTIETILGQKYDQAQFKLVAESQRANGAYYIVSSAQKAIEQMSPFAEESVRVAKILLKSTDAAAIKAAQGLSENIDKYKQLTVELDSLEQPARDYIYRRSLSMTSRNLLLGGSRAAKSAHIGCSHSGQIDEIMSQVKF